MDQIKQQQPLDKVTEENIELMTTGETAEIVRVKPGTLTNWRCTKREVIPYVKIGRKVFYRRSDVIAWMNDRCVRDF